MNPDVLPNSIRSGLPLSPTQQLFWAGQKLHPDSPLYNMAIALTIEGELDVVLFRKAFDQTVAAHEALRTVFVEDSGEVSACVLEHVSYDLPLIDFSDAEDPDAEARRWMQASTKAPLPLARQLSLPALLKVGTNRHVFFLSQHHLVTDASSFGVIFQTLSSEYERLDGRSLNGGDPASSQPQMSQFVADLTRVGASTMGQAARAHWEGREGGSPRAPRFYGREVSASSTDSRRLRCHPGTNWLGRAREIVRGNTGALSEDAGLFDLLATCLYATMYRTSGRRDLSMLVPAHNRSRASAKRTAGVLIEMFEHGIEIEPDESFVSLLDKVSSETRTLLKNAVPGASDGVKFGAGAVLNYIKAAYPDFAGNATSPEWLHSGHADPHHAVRLQAYDFGSTGELDLFLDLNEEVFPDELASRFVGHFECVARALLEDPDSLIDDVDVLSPPEREVLVSRGTGKGVSDVPDVLDAIWRCASHNPSDDAVTAGNASYTYEALRLNVQNVARGLTRFGVQAGDIVAIDVERSPRTIILMLAALEADAAFLPVDRSAPVARRRFAVENSGARMVVVDHTDRGDDYAGTHVVAWADLLDVETSGALTKQVGAHAATQRRDHNDHRAYIIYTSGSTGEPKGVEVGRVALSNYVHWAVDQYSTNGAPISMPVFTNPAVDLTLTSLFVPLASGGTAIVFDESMDAAGTALPEALTDSRISVLKMTPSHAQIVLQSRLAAGAPKTVILGGENLRTDVARDLAAHLGDEVEVYNEYGPTEATVGCVAHRFDLNTDREVYVPVGFPISNANVAVLNSRGRMVPAGVEGELYISGDCLAFGYVNNPTETDARFAEGDGGLAGRWYRTGDLVRFNESGRLVCIGRADDQLKIRGHRVEPAEIERVLTSLSGVQSAAVAKVGSADRQIATRYCSRCGISSEYPLVTFDDAGLCSTCRAFEVVESNASRYFGEMDELRDVLLGSAGAASGEYDCMMLLSGGKDSTYALYRLVHMGLRVFAFTLDNGYISDQAKANINRVVADLGVKHEYGTTPAMNAIFVDSLQRFSNVCNGCFKTLYTLALHAARREGIGVIVTGLSRGQFFETRLTEEMFTLPTLDPDGIDEAVLAARKRYHRVDDAVHRLLDTSVFQDDTIFEEIRFVDFYRYCDASLEEMLGYLDAHAPWVRPADTGRSTNCLINDVGIHVHKLERGFHNYALPYAWDVRMGCKSRDEAMEELEDDIDEGNVSKILGEIGYVPVPKLADPVVERLVAYYVSEDGGDVDSAALKSSLSATLPQHMVPDTFVRLDALPLTRAGKLDRSALPTAGPQRVAAHAGAAVPGPSIAPRNPIEETVAEIWCHVLGLRQVGVTDSFVSLGGTSLLAIRVVARISRAFSVDVPLRAAFERPTIEEVAQLVEELLIADIQNESN